MADCQSRSLGSMNRCSSMFVVGCCLVSLVGACTSAAPVAIAEPTPVPVVAAEPTPPPPDAELAQQQDDGHDDVGGSGVPFPPPRNLVAWDPIITLDDPRAMLAAAAAHPLAVGWPTGSELNQMLGGAWQVNWAQVIEAPPTPTSSEDCSATVLPTESLMADGVDVFYTTLDDRSFVLLTRRADDVALLLDLLRSDVCVPADAKSVAIDAPAVPDVDDRLAVTFTGFEGAGDLHLAFLAVTKGDLLLLAAADAVDYDDAVAKQEILAQIVSASLERIQG